MNTARWTLETGPRALVERRGSNAARSLLGDLVTGRPRGRDGRTPVRTARPHDRRPRTLAAFGARGVATDANGSTYEGGLTDGALDGPNAGAEDAFIRKYGP